ncbi:hypothetical protein FRB97_007826 [Tulasnella sp. 331]|nr:hypothetical protein FRB97_007826 [Tulasnella sp. 331]
MKSLAGAVQLMRLCGLHKIKSSDWEAQDPTPQHCLIPPAKDSVELGERICLFWMAYQFDHMCSLISGLPPDHYFEAETETVWPRQIEEYELEYQTMVGSFMERLPPTTYDPMTMEIEVFPTPQLNVSVILAHRIAMGTFIQLYNAMGLSSRSYGPLYDRRLTMARRSMQLMLAFIKSGTPLKSVPIACAARVIAQHIRKLQSEGAAPDSTELVDLQASLQTLFNSMIPVRHLLPVISLQIQRLQDFLDGGQEEDLSTHVGFVDVGGH